MEQHNILTAEKKTAKKQKIRHTLAVGWWAAMGYGRQLPADDVFTSHANVNVNKSYFALLYCVTRHTTLANCWWDRPYVCTSVCSCGDNWRMCVFHYPTNEQTHGASSPPTKPVQDQFSCHMICVWGAFFSLMHPLHLFYTNRQPSPSPRDRKMIIFIANRSYFPQPGRVYKAQEKAKHTEAQYFHLSFP